MVANESQNGPFRRNDRKKKINRRILKRRRNNERNQEFSFSTSQNIYNYILYAETATIREMAR